MRNPNWLKNVLRGPATFVVLMCFASLVASDAQTVITGAVFNESNGRDPGPLTQGTNGNFYGTTRADGAGPAGTFFEITPGGKLTTLYNFCQKPNCPDGAGPSGALLLGIDRAFYGTTLEGGANVNGGTVFKVTPPGTLTTLYSFCSNTRGGLCLDGANPEEGMVWGLDGSFYGTTAAGGTGYTGNCNGYYLGCGTVFRITKDGRLTTLYNFCTVGNYVCDDGWLPTGPLTLGKNGNLYGTTWGGGNYAAECGVGGCGTVFEITPEGKLTTIYDFCSLANCADGDLPAGLALAADGNFYGATSYGAASTNCTNVSFGCGTVFKMTPQGRLTTLYNFCSLPNCADGQFPNGVLVLAADGDFYGTTEYGGLYNDNVVCNNLGCGTIFQMTPGGELTTLYSFCSLTECADGAGPGVLMQSTNGTFYGTASVGGNPICIYTGCGTVYSLSMALGPLVEANPAFARAGRTIGILGNNLTGTSNVAFNSLSASFTVVSETLIEATVPAGATTGYVTVTTPSGTLTSNVPFHVIK
jgi:uncharacterized repeat protein (TIGR03803 family)